MSPSKELGVPNYGTAPPTPPKALLGRVRASRPIRPHSVAFLELDGVRDEGGGGDFWGIDGHRTGMLRPRKGRQPSKPKARCLLHPSPRLLQKVEVGAWHIRIGRARPHLMKQRFLRMTTSRARGASPVLASPLPLLTPTHPKPLLLGDVGILGGFLP